MADPSLLGPTDNLDTILEPYDSDQSELLRHRGLLLNSRMEDDTRCSVRCCPLCRQVSSQDLHHVGWSADAPSIMCEIKGTVLKPYKRTEAHGMVSLDRRSDRTLITNPVRSLGTSQSSGVCDVTESRRYHATGLEFESDEVGEVDGSGILLGEVQGQDQGG